MAIVKIFNVMVWGYRMKVINQINLVRQMVVFFFNGYFFFDDYLELESCSDVKYEYIDGQIYVMVGIGGIYNIISGNFYMVFCSCF